jgi:hypothetical protein
VADFAHQHPQTFQKWKDESNSVICLSVKNELKLLQLWEKYQPITPSVIFYEPDFSEYTSICLYADEPIRKKLKHLPLIGKESKI